MLRESQQKIVWRRKKKKHPHQQKNKEKNPP